MTGRRLAELDAQGFDRLVGRLGLADAYLRAGYVEASCLLDGGEPVFLHAGGPGGDVVLAAVLRAAPGGARDVVTPYGYGGPAAAGRRPPVGRFWELYEAWCRERGVVASFIRFHPLLANERLAGPGVRVERLGPTVGWRLRDGADLLGGMHPTHRNKVRKALGAGTEVAVTAAPADLEPFVRLYESTMARVRAGDYYRFPAAYWERLRSGLGEGLVRLDAVAGGELVASTLCLAGARWLHYHLSATSEAGRRTGAANLVLLRAAEWGRERGLEEFHLGGGLGGREDSLYAFKAHFAPGGRREMYVGKAVHDERRYLELAGASRVDLDGYFPAYRRPPGGRQ